MNKHYVYLWELAKLRHTRYCHFEQILAIYGTNPQGGNDYPLELWLRLIFSLCIPSNGMRRGNIIVIFMQNSKTMNLCKT